MYVNLIYDIFITILMCNFAKILDLCSAQKLDATIIHINIQKTIFRKKNYLTRFKFLDIDNFICQIELFKDIC